MNNSEEVCALEEIRTKLSQRIGGIYATIGCHLDDNDAYTDYTLFKKRKQIATYKGNVTARNFKSASITAKVNIIKEPCAKELMIQLSAREFAQFMSDNIGEVLTDNVAQEK